MNKKIFLTLIAVVAAISASAQGRLDLRINEVMVQNNSNYVDQYGNHSAWIEIFNASTSSNAIEQMFITTLTRDKIKAAFDKEKNTSKKGIQIMTEFSEGAGKGKVYVIPKGDVDTKVKPRSHVVFFADGNDAAGTFHLPFTLNAGDYIALYDVNGDLVDELEIPTALGADQSFARKSEDKIELHVNHMNPTDDDFANAPSMFVDSLWQKRDGSNEDMAITPGKFNARPVNENIANFKRDDPSGILLTLMSMGVVFSALLLLFLLFMLFGKIFAAKDKKNKEKVVVTVADDTISESQDNDNDEAIAAICMALYQHLNAHDEESGVLTFNRSNNSAWGAKSNMLLRMPERHNNH